MFWSGWNDVSWHNQKIHSPSLQQLAEDGILLDQYYVQPTCSPSRAAFMTGQYPYRLGRQHMYIKPLMPSGLPANVKIMPEYFKEAGYNTHAVGKEVGTGMNVLKILYLNHSYLFQS